MGGIILNVSVSQSVQIEIRLGEELDGPYHKLQKIDNKLKEERRERERHIVRGGRESKRKSKKRTNFIYFFFF
jgi:hypothetical protein